LLLKILLLINEKRVERKSVVSAKL
jgi:hypothetical protein